MIRSTRFVKSALTNPGVRGDHGEEGERGIPSVCSVGQLSALSLPFAPPVQTQHRESLQGVIDV